MVLPGTWDAAQLVNETAEAHPPERSEWDGLSEAVPSPNDYPPYHPLRQQFWNAKSQNFTHCPGRWQPWRS